MQINNHTQTVCFLTSKAIINLASWSQDVIIIDMFRKKGRTEETISYFNVSGKTSVYEQRGWRRGGASWVDLKVWDLQMTLQKVCYKALAGSVIIHVLWCVV